MKNSLDDACPFLSQQVCLVQRIYSPNLEWARYEMQGRGKEEYLGEEDYIYTHDIALHSNVMDINKLPA